MRKVPNLSISPEKAFFIIAKARQSDSEARGAGSASASDDDMPEDHSKDTDRSELSGFIRGLNVALSLWCGSAAVTAISTTGAISAPRRRVPTTTVRHPT
jgi:hypothetical protein